MEYKELHRKNVAELREIAKTQFPDIEGTSAMHKEKLLDVLCHRMGIDRHAHHAPVVAGVSLPELKKQVRALKAQKSQLQGPADRKARAKARKQIHRLKHKMRRLVEIAPKE